ncbi:SPASM domain-containing protein, partial [Chloroflexota bacterium]
LENMRFLSSARDRERNTLSAVQVVMRDNQKEMGDFVELFYKLGFDCVTFKPLDVLTTKEDLKSIADREFIYRVFLDLKGKYKDRIGLSEWNLSINKIDNDCLARVASGSIFINCMGDISPCCNLGHHVPIVKTSSLLKRIRQDNFFSFGNIVSKCFEGIIDGRAYKSFVNAFHNRYLPRPCSECRLISNGLSKRLSRI